MGQTVLIIDSAKAGAYDTSSRRHRLLQGLTNLFSGLLGGNVIGTVQRMPAATAVRASGTLTCATVIATNTCTVLGITFTGVANNTASPTSVQFKIGTTDATCAANLAAVLNAHTTVNQLVLATSAAGVVTITSILPGISGNLIAIAGGQSTIAASAAALASGAGVFTSYLFGT